MKHPNYIKRAMYWSLALLALVLVQLYLYDLGAQIFSVIFANLTALLCLNVKFHFEAQ